MSINSNDLVFGKSRGGYYQSPYYDIARTYLPKNMEDLIRWCRYYFENNPIIHQAIRRMSSYPVTDIMLSDEISKTAKGRAEDLVSQLKLRDHSIDIAIQYFTFGNAFSSVSHPFLRYYKCLKCTKENSQAMILQTRGYKKSIFKIRTVSGKQIITLDRCHFCRETNVPVDIIDKPVSDISKIKIILWDPSYIRIDYNEVSGERNYRYILPESSRKSILDGLTFPITTSPKIFIDAALQDKDIIIEKSSFFHFARNTVCSSNGWGIPIIQPVLRELFYMQVLKKASEAIAMQHVTPLTILFPGDSGGSNVYQTLDLGNWSKNVEDQIKKWRRDPNHMPIMPSPVGVEYVGGQYRTLDPHPLIEQSASDISVGMGVPKEFLYGGTSFSGASIALRMLENDFINLRTSLLEYMNEFLIPRISKIANVSTFTLKFGNMRTADDIQIKETLLRLAQHGLISKTTVLAELGFDYAKETDNMLSEQKDLANLQSTITSDEGGIPTTLSNINVPFGDGSMMIGQVGEEAISVISKIISTADPLIGTQILEYMQSISPNVHGAVSSFIANNSRSSVPKEDKEGGTDMRPTPSQKPPRRTKSTI